MASTRLFLGVTTVLALAGVTYAQSSTQQASKLNDDGKALMKVSNYTRAAEKFREAIKLSPEGRFYLNLCMALYQDGKLGEALAACRAVEPNGATGAQVTQAQNIVDQYIAPRMREAGLDPDATTGNGTGGDGTTGNGTGGDGTTGNGTGGDGTTGNGTGGDGTTGNGTGGDGTTGNGTTGNGTGAVDNFTVAPPPSLFDQTKVAPTHEYQWTLGAQLLFMRNSIGTKGDWETGGAGLRVLGDYALSANRQFGAQGHLTFFSVPSKDGGAYVDATLNVFDLGVSVYKEVCKKRLCVKPLAGGQIALQQLNLGSGIDDVSFAVFGVRAELGLEYALGKRYENVLTVAAGLDLYLPAQLNEDTGDDPADYGLDRSSANVYFGLGYTRRFNSPLGGAPLFRLQ